MYRISRLSPSQGDALKARVDPWTPLDAHDPGTAKARPIRKGRTYRLPPQLTKKNINTKGGRKHSGSKKSQERNRSDGADDDDGDDDGRENGWSSWVALDGRLT